MDAAVTAWINGWAGASPVLDAVMRAVTGYGVPLIVVLVVLSWWGGDRARLRHVAISAGLAFLLGLALNQLILLGVHRVRPYDAGVTQLLIAKSADWSFPSDHATASVAVAAMVLAKGLRRFGLALAGLAALVCLSRVFVGMHYAGDILGGAATGILAVLTVSALWRAGNALENRLVRIL